MPSASTIILIGPMGAGKSTIGRLLSEHLDIEFADLDREIEVASGATIPWIFDIEGEDGFRKRESSVLEDVLNQQSIVLATGGGCVLSPINRQLLAKSGYVVYLKTSVGHQLQRTAKDKNRPLLQTQNPRAVLIEMAQYRNPLYDEVAHLAIDTDAKPPRLVAQEILQSLQKSLT
jgi:shikimate kinase